MRSIDLGNNRTGWRTNAETDGSPPLAETLQADVAIVGAGYTGLSAAWHLARRHGASVVVLEAHQPGWGASGRNGGFCCLGGGKISLETLAARHGQTAVDQWLNAQAASVRQVQALVDELGIDVEAQAEGEYALAHSVRAARSLERETDTLRRHHGLATHWIPAAAMADAGLGGHLRFGAAFTAQGFGLNPLAYACGLATACRAAGVRIHGDSAVTGLSASPAGGHVLTTQHGAVIARRVVIATNGYTDERVFPQLAGRLLPVLSNVLMSAPITATDYAAQGWTTPYAAYDTRNLVHYFRRLPDGRFLFGGRGGLTDTPAVRQRLFQALERRFRERFPVWKDVPIERRWNGWACLARDLHPHIAELTPGVFCALAYHGNGVAMATWSGAAVAALAMGDPAGAAIPAFLRRPPPRFPLPALRRAYLAAAYLGYGLLDRL